SVEAPPGRPPYPDELSMSSPPAARHSLTDGGPVAVTGAGGFIGSAITRQLLDRGVRVVAVDQPGGDLSNLEGLDVERRAAEGRARHAVRDATHQCAGVFHTAAIYGFWARDSRIFYDVNVSGTRHVMEEAAAAGVERIVYTSTVGTLGLSHAASG